MLPLTHMLLGALWSAAPIAPSEPTPQLDLQVFDENCDRAPVDGNVWWRWEPPARILYCVRCPKGERPRPEFNTPEAVGGKSPGRGDTIFEVEPGERYVYAYVGKDIRPIEGEVTITPHRRFTEREIRVEPEKVETQTLRIRPKRADGSPLAHDFQVTVESLATGLPLFHAELDSYESQYADVLPVGRYRVRVESGESLPACASGWWPKPAPFGDWIEDVELTTAAPVELEPCMWFGGKLRLTLDVPRGEVANEESWRARYPTGWYPPEFGWLRLGTKGPGARVTLRPDPGALPRSRERGMPVLNGNTLRFLLDGHGRAQLDAMLPGSTQTSADWIPPGAYIARIEAREYAPAEAKVQIEIDETTELRVELTPR